MTENLCMICGKEIKEKHGIFPLRKWIINRAILGELINLRGHKICLENIEKLVMVPNGFRLIEIEKVVKKMKQGTVYALKIKKGHNAILGIAGRYTHVRSGGMLTSAGNSAPGFSLDSLNNKAERRINAAG